MYRFFHGKRRRNLFFVFFLLFAWEHFRNCASFHSTAGVKSVLSILLQCANRGNSVKNFFPPLASTKGSSSGNRIVPLTRWLFVAVNVWVLRQTSDHISFQLPSQFFCLSGKKKKIHFWKALSGRDAGVCSTTGERARFWFDQIHLRSALICCHTAASLRDRSTMEEKKTFIDRVPLSKTFLTQASRGDARTWTVHRKRRIYDSDTTP